MWVLAQAISEVHSNQHITELVTRGLLCARGVHGVSCSACGADVDLFDTLLPWLNRASAPTAIWSARLECPCVHLFNDVGGGNDTAEVVPHRSVAWEL